MFHRRGFRSNRCLQTAVILFLVVVISAALMLGRLVSFSRTEYTHYIPLTRSGGTTTVLTAQKHTAAVQTRNLLRSSPPVYTPGPLLEDDWFRVTDENTVWTGTTQVEIFRITYENAHNQVTVAGNDGAKVIAPGTENTYSFALENTGDDSVEFTMTMKAWFSTGEGYAIPVEVKVTRDTDGTFLVGSEEAYADVLELNAVDESGSLSRGYVMPYTLSWQWPFAGNDDYDTLLGNLSEQEDISLTIVIETTASYEPCSGGIPGTGDDTPIALLLSAMIVSAAAMLFLLVFGRRGEKNEKA